MEVSVGLGGMWNARLYLSHWPARTEIHPHWFFFHFPSLKCCSVKRLSILRSSAPALILGHDSALWNKEEADSLWEIQLFRKLDHMCTHTVYHKVFRCVRQVLPSYFEIMGLFFFFTEAKSQFFTYCIESNMFKNIQTSTLADYKVICNDLFSINYYFKY